ncbi:MAG: flagellar basal body-associated FliL family protein, partial [Pseudomonadales bacterium]
LPDEEDEGKKKGGNRLLWIIIGVLSVLLIVGGTIMGTLYMSGFFDKRAETSVEEELAALEEETAEEEDPLAAAPTPKPMPDRERFEATYHELERPLTSNIAYSRKVIQLKVAFMTYFDERVFDNVQRHEMAIRAAILDHLRLITEEQLAEPDFRANLGEEIQLKVNAMLEELENFGGIEQVHFTEFVVQ